MSSLAAGDIKSASQPGEPLSVFQCDELCPPFSANADISIGRFVDGDDGDDRGNPADDQPRRYPDHDYDPYRRKVEQEATQAVEQLRCETAEERERVWTNLNSVYRSLSTFFERVDPWESRQKGKSSQATIDDLPGFVSCDLDLSRLNEIHDLLWMAGRPLIGRPLHRHRLLGREIVMTEQADLHLLVDEDRIFIKPLPLYLLSHAFWRTYLCGKDIALHSSARGFLLSYDWLIRSPADFQIARKMGLLPETEPKIRWCDWQRFIASFHTHVNSDHRTYGWINMRFFFGELRLRRINSMYRLLPRFGFKYFVRGYLYGYNRYSAFFQRRIAWILILFVLVELVLSGMEVGLSLDKLAEADAFVDTCYGFVIFSMTLVAAVLAFIIFMFVSMYLINMVLAIRHSRRFAHQDSEDYQKHACGGPTGHA